LQAQIWDAALKTMGQPAVRERLQEVGFEPAQAQTPQEMSASLKADYERVGGLLKTIRFKPESCGARKGIAAPRDCLILIADGRFPFDEGPHRLAAGIRANV
jgi:hypothetical protein